MSRAVLPSSSSLVISQIKNILLLACGLAMLSAGSSASASISLSVPSTSTTGTYTVSWSGVDERVTIQERAPGSSDWVDLVTESEAPSGSIERTVHEVGVWTYQAINCYLKTFAPGALVEICDNIVQDTISVDIAEPYVQAQWDTDAVNESGSTATFTWSADRATSCTVRDFPGRADFTTTATSNSITYTPPSIMSETISADTVVECTGPGGTAVANDHLYVFPINDQPQLTAITTKRLQIQEDAVGNANIAYQDVVFSDEETSYANLVVEAWSDDTDIVADTNITIEPLSGYQNRKRIWVTPNKDAYGSVAIYVKVTDELINNVTRSYKIPFTVNIAPVNDAPEISCPGTPQNTDEDVPIIVNCDVVDVDNDLTSTEINYTVSSSNTTLVPASGYFGVVKQSDHVEVTVNPALNQADQSSTLTVTVSDGEYNASSSFVINVLPVNDKPTLSVSGVPASIQEEGEASITLTIGDVETAADDLTVTATLISGSSTVFPASGISVSQVGGTRTLVIRPADDQYGTGTFKVVVADTGQGASPATTTESTFSLTVNNVNDAPEITVFDGINNPPPNGSVTSINTVEDQRSSPVTFSVIDRDDDMIGLSVSVVSDPNHAVLIATFNDGSPVLGSGSRTLQVLPRPDASGSAILRLVVTDSSNGAVDTVEFDVHVAPVNDAPVISDIPDQTISSYGSIPPITFNVSDIDSALTASSLSVSSSNPSVLSDSQIAKVLSGSNGTLTLTPESGAFGETTLTVAVTDGELTTSTSFKVTLTGLDGLPGFDYDLESTYFAPTSGIGEFVAVTQGTIGVNQGTATYQVNMDLPPAINDLKPSMGFGYSSANTGSGDLGVGWALTGMSSIYRCVFNKVQDQFITFTSSDSLCLDGSTLYLEEYGYSRTIGSFSGNRRFRTEIDSLSKIESNATTTEFTVKLKSGQTLYYGGEVDNANNSLVHLGLDSENPIKEWKLRKVADRYGNEYQIYYSQNSTTGDHHISHIYYEPGATVVFNYQDRVTAADDGADTVDIVWGYQKGYKYQSTKLLDSVQTYVGSTAASPSSGTLVRKYDLEYEHSPATYRYRLTHITECGYTSTGAEQCARPLDFDWQDGELGFEGTEESIVECDSTTTIPVRQMVDFNNDGLEDILSDGFIAYRNPEAVDHPEDASYNCYIAPDWLKFEGGAAGWSQPQAYRTELGWNVVAKDPSTDQRKILSLDFVAETATVSTNPANDGYTVVSDTDRNGLHELSWNTELVGNYYDSTYGLNDLQEAVFADFDGDDKPELFFTSVDTDGGSPFPAKLNVFFHPAVGIFYLGDNSLSITPSYTFSQSPYSFGPRVLSGGVNRVLVDLNGDGIKDVAYHKGGTWRIVPVTHSGEFGSEINTGIPTAYSSTNHMNFAYVADVNKDGLEDIVECSGAVLLAGHSGNTGVMENGYALYKSGFSPIGSSGGCPLSPGSAAWQYASRLRGDFNNDGLPDLFSLSGTAARAAKVEQPDMMTSITDGFGRVVELSYSPLKPSIYSPGSETKKPSYPLVYGPRSQQVVEELRVDAGLAATGTRNITRYSYVGSRVDMSKRGMLGFARVIAHDVTGNTETTTTYDQEYPTIGRVTSAIVRDLADDELIKQSTFEYSNKTSIQHGQIVWASSILHQQYAADGANKGDEIRATLEVVTDMDAYGNAGTVEKTAGARWNGSTKLIEGISGSSVQTREFDNNEEDWLIGFATSQTLTSTNHDADPVSTKTVIRGFEPEPDTLDVKVQTNFVGEPMESSVTTIRNDSGVVTSVSGSAKDYDGSTLPARTATFSNFESGMYPKTMTNAEQHASQLTYDNRFGSVASTTDANQLTQSTIYDSLGRSVETEDAKGNRKLLRSFYCSASPSLITCPSTAVYGTATFVVNDNAANRYGAPVSVVYYDRLQRQVRSEVFNFNGDVVKVDTVYNSDGTVSSTSEPYTLTASYWTSYESYDVLDRPKSVSRADGGSVIFTYDQISADWVYTTQVATIVDTDGVEVSNSQQEKKTYTNALGQVVSVEDAGITSVDYEYDGLGNLTKTIVDNNDTTTITIDYDVAGNKLAMTDPDAGSMAYSYNGFGELRVQRWAPDTASEKSITYTYDRLGRQTGRVDTGGSTPASYSWVWDTRLTGMLSSVSGNGYHSEYYYFADGLLDYQSTTLSGLGNAKTFRYTYDAFGRPETKTYPSGLTLQNEYHAAGAMVRTRDISAGAPGKVLWALAEDSDARGTTYRQIYGNGVVSDKSYNVTNGLLLGIVSGSSQITGSILDVVGNIQNLHYEFDSVGNLGERRSQRTNANGTVVEDLLETFGYDDLNRLTSAQFSSSGIIQTTDSYDYDNLGNLTSRSGIAGVLQYDGTTGGGVHALSAAGDTHYHYDAFGNLSSRVSATSGTDSLAYDAFNKPTQIGNSYFSYGPDHARYKQTSGGKTTFYLDSGSYEVVITATGTVENSYVGDYLLHSKAANDTTYTYLHRDHLGSVDAMTDASGNVIQRMSFNAWGERRPPAWGQGEVDASQFATTRGFTGHVMLDDTKLVHMNGRIYDPVVGRMLSADLFVQSPYNSQSYNRYSYVFNNPLSVVDPSGYLGEDDIVHATNESRAQGVAWWSGFFAAGGEVYNGSWPAARGYTRQGYKIGSEYQFNLHLDTDRMNEDLLEELGVADLMDGANPTASDGGGANGAGLDGDGGSLSGTLGEVITGDGVFPYEWAPLAEALEQGGFIKPDETTIIGHGDKNSLEYRRHLRPVDDWVEVLEGKVKAGDTIRIFSCNVGREGGFAQELSRILNVTVIAPNNYVNYDTKGEHGLFTIGSYGEYGIWNGKFETYVNGVKQ